MSFYPGEKVIHWTYGLGEITRIEEKTLSGKSTDCYVFQTSDLMIWIPVDGQAQSSLRRPTTPVEFQQLFTILSSPQEKLLEDRVQRKDQLMTRMKDGQLSSICEVVRDLTHYQRSNKMTDQEKSILERAINSLLTEWTYSLGIPLTQAHQTLTSLLAR